MFYFAPHLLEASKKEKEEGWLPPSGPRIDWPKYWHHGVIPYFIDPKTYGKYNQPVHIFFLIFAGYVSLSVKRSLQES